jgi:nucleotide-binding universal stress UspA family protein
MLEIKNILVPIDFADCSRRALELALELAESYGAKIKLLHTWVVPAYVAPSVAVSIAGRMEPLETLARREAESQLATFLGQVRNPTKIPMDAEIAHGLPEELILDRAGDCDLVVMGTHGRRGFAHFAIGSVTEKVMRRSPRPVLVVNAGDPNHAA